MSSIQKVIIGLPESVPQWFNFHCHAMLTAIATKDPQLIVRAEAAGKLKPLLQIMAQRRRTLYQDFLRDFDVTADSDIVHSAVTEQLLSLPLTTWTGGAPLDDAFLETLPSLPADDTRSYRELEAEGIYPTV